MLAQLSNQIPLHLISELNHLLMVSKLIVLAETSEDFTARRKYHMIFSPRISKRVYMIANEIEVPFNYYDPDGSYAEDCDAFVNGLERYIHNLQSSDGQTMSVSDVDYIFDQLKPYDNQ